MAQQTAVSKMETTQTAVEWFFMTLALTPMTDWYNVLEQAKAMEKEQGIDLIKQTAMFMAAANYDEDIAKMSYEDVYNSYYNETYNK
jgi:hypothetical protein